MLDLFSDTPPWRSRWPQRGGASSICANAPGAAASDCRRRQPVAEPPDGHAGRYTMSVAMTNAAAGWADFYHRSPRLLYAPVDPVTRHTWPPMPAVFHELAGGSTARRLSGLFPRRCLI